VDAPAFSMAKHKVTNGEYLEFVRAGAAVRSSGVDAPDAGATAACLREIRCPSIGRFLT